MTNLICFQVLGPFFVPFLGVPLVDKGGNSFRLWVSGYSYSKRGSTSMIHFYYHFSVIAVIASCYTCRPLVLGVFNTPELYALIVYLFYCSRRLKKSFNFSSVLWGCLPFCVFKWLRLFINYSPLKITFNKPTVRTYVVS